MEGLAERLEFNVGGRWSSVKERVKGLSVKGFREIRQVIWYRREKKGSMFFPAYTRFPVFGFWFFPFFWRLAEHPVGTVITAKTASGT